MIRPVSLQFVGKDNLDTYDTPVRILHKVDFLLFSLLIIFFLIEIRVNLFPVQKSW